MDSDMYEYNGHLSSTYFNTANNSFAAAIGGISALGAVEDVSDLEKYVNRIKKYKGGKEKKNANGNSIVIVGGDYYSKKKTKRELQNEIDDIFECSQNENCDIENDENTLKNDAGPTNDISSWLTDETHNTNSIQKIDRDNFSQFSLNDTNITDFYN